MKFKIDENLPIELVDLLITAGHQAMTVYEQHLQGKADCIGIGIHPEGNADAQSFSCSFCQSIINSLRCPK